MGGKPADHELTELAREAAVAVGVAPPKSVYEINAREPNAFAASNLFSRSQTVAVTSGLRSALSTNELKAVLAHEMGHLKHSDVARNMHVAIAIAGMGGVYDMGRMLFDSSSRKKKRSKDDDEKDNSAAVGLMLMGAGLAAQGLAHGLRLAASRDAELKADRAAAEAFGSDAMISALRKIDSTAANRPADLRNSAAGRRFAFAMISDGESKPAESWREDAGSWMAARPNGDKKGGVLNGITKAWRKVAKALRTHPPIDDRVAALEKATAAGLVPASMPSSSKSWF